MIVDGKKQDQAQLPIRGEQFSRRVFLGHTIELGISASAIGALLTACGSNQSSSSSGKVPPLLYGFYGTPAEISIYKQVGDLYQKKNPDVQLQYTYADPQGFFEKLPLLFRSNAAPDVFMAAESWVSGLSSLGAFADLTPYLKANNITEEVWLPGALNPGKVHGQILSLPSVVYPKGIAYNKTIFDKFNVPIPEPGWTQNDFLEIVQRLTTGQGNSKVWGMNNSFGTVYPYDVPTLYGGMIFDYNTGQMTATTPKVSSALQLLQDLIRKYKVMPDTAESQSLQGGFITGKFAMDIYAGYDMQDWTTEIGDNFTWGIVSYPKEWVGTFQNNNVSVWSQSKHKDAAWEFAKFIATDPDAQALQGNYATPALSSVAAIWQKSLPQAYAHLNYQPLIDSMGDMLVAYQGGNYDQVWEVFATHVEAVEDQGAAVSQALQDVQQRGEAILADQL